MEFHKLTTDEKLRVRETILKIANHFGGKNSFLTIIEEMRKEKTNPLLHQSSVFHHPKFKINWQKSIHKESLTNLFYAVKKEEKDGSVLKNLTPKDFKATLNMVKALRTIEFVVTSKVDTIEGLNFPLFDFVDENDAKIGVVFKAFFFYPVEYLKKAMSYEPKEEKKELQE